MVARAGIEIGLPVAADGDAVDRKPGPPQPRNAVPIERGGELLPARSGSGHSLAEEQAGSVAFQTADQQIASRGLAARIEQQVSGRRPMITRQYSVGDCAAAALDPGDRSDEAPVVLDNQRPEWLPGAKHAHQADSSSARAAGSVTSLRRQRSFHSGAASRSSACESR